VSDKPAIAALRRAYRRAIRAEVRYVDSLPLYATQSQLDAALRLAQSTTAALRTLQAHPDYHTGATISVVA
jgi:hypothetical protein